MDRVSENPYQSPEVSEPQGRVAEPVTGAEVRRWPFTLGLCATTAVTCIVLLLLNRSTLDGGLFQALIAIAWWGGVAIALWLAFARCRNIGIAGSWGMFLTIPGLNVLLLVALFALPEGFAIRGKFDGPARVVLAGAALAFVFGLVAILFLG